jgi:hypothetical protein
MRSQEGAKYHHSAGSMFANVCYPYQASASSRNRISFAREGVLSERGRELTKCERFASTEFLRGRGLWYQP